MATPLDDNRERRVEEAVCRFVEMKAHGEGPDLHAFAQQYGDLEPEIVESLLALDEIDDLFDSVVRADASDFQVAAPAGELVGQTIGSFEIKEMIGRGGMGVVYLARDTKLDRSVAIKSLPAGLAGDSTAKTRFKREAKLLASLNHPNIAAIHEIIESDESGGYLVLEYIAGETLAARIAREPLTLEQALSIGCQVAEAVSAAHHKGVVHRDLKPANIKITPGGAVKVLDFGLAKASARDDEEQSTTTTQAGHVIGTPAYMSPEQARGGSVDARTDIWSFGCVMYEMLTGKPPFQGETASDTVANILRTEPDWQALPESTPANIRVLLRRCLEQDPAHRLHDVADARIEMNETLSGTVEAYDLPKESIELPSETAATSRLFRREVILVALTCFITGALITGAILMNLARPGPPEPPVVSRSVIPLPADKPLYTVGAPRSFLAIPPDGTCLVYVGRGEDGIRRLHVRHMDDLEVKLIPGTEGALNPFFSPDGQWVGFSTPDLKIVSLAGGEPLPLVEGFRGSVFGSWAEDGTIVFSGPMGNRDSGLYRISEHGGTPKIVMPRDKGVSAIRYPQVLPRGDAILYNRHFFDGDACIEVFFPETGKTHKVLDNAYYARYVSSGHLIFLRDYVFMAVPFDIERLKITGPFVDLLDEAQFGWQYRPPVVAVSQNGTMLYASYISLSDVSQSEEIEYELVWVDRQGGTEFLAAPDHSCAVPRLSPDERQVALSVRQKERDSVHLLNIEGGTTTPLITEDGYRPLWSPDGTQIVFWSGNDRGVFRKTVGSGDPPELLANEPFPRSFLWPHSWSSDGKFIACTVQIGNWDDIWILPLDGDRKPYPLLDTEDGEYNPAFSPDGRWLAYVLDKSGRPEVYLMRYPDGGAPIQVSSGGGIGPIWSRDGRELYYINNRTMMAVEIGPEQDSIVGTPEALFTLEYQDHYSTEGNLIRKYDISRDGRFLMLRRAKGAEAQVICVHNWFEELKRLAPPR